MKQRTPSNKQFLIILGLLVFISHAANTREIKAKKWRIATTKTVKNFNPKPILLSEMFRHGARTPVFEGYLKSSAPHIKEIENIGNGNLTGNGEHMHLLLGMQLKKDYPHLFNPDDSEFSLYQSPRFQSMQLPKINNFQYKLRSSSIHRCIVSAQSHLLGLYPPGKEIGDHLNHPDHNFAFEPSYSNLSVNFSNSTNSALPFGLRVFPVQTQSLKEDKIFFPGLTSACNLPYNIHKDHAKFSEQITEKYLKKGGSIERLNKAGFTADLYLPNYSKRQVKEWRLDTMAQFYDSLR